jgi:hypothetical protein
MNSEIIWQFISTKSDDLLVVPSDGVRALTTLTRFLEDELGRAACEKALILGVIALFIMTALLTVELLDTH